MRKRLAALVVLGISFAVTLLLGEIGLRLTSAHWLRVLDVEMWRYARLVKLESARPGLVEEHRPNADAFLMGARVRTDEYGFRLPDPATEARRKPGNRRVAALGDSLTFGWGVPEGETYADQLERLLAKQCRQPATVFNTGVGNSNTSMQLARYREIIRPLRPEWLIVGFFINDAEPDPVPSTNPLVWRSALAALLSTRLLQHSDTTLRDYNVYYHGLYTDGRPGWERNKAALRELGAELRRDGVRQTLILLPELHEPHRFGSFADVYARVARIGRESGFEVIDPSAAFPKGSGERFWVSRDDAHPDAAAQAIFARALTTSRHACGS